MEPEAQNIANMFFNIQDETDTQLVINALTSVDPETQELALDIIKSELDSWNSDRELILN